MSLDESAQPPPDRPEAAGRPRPGERPDGTGSGLPWPIEPDPAATNLTGRQLWHFAGGRAAAVEVETAAEKIRIGAGDPRIAGLGIRRDRAGRPWPAGFAHDPETGEPLPPPGPAPAPDLLDIDPDSAREIPLPGGLSLLAAAGLPAAVHLFQENLGALEAWDGVAFSPLGRLPPVDTPGEGVDLPGGLAAGPPGLAYRAGDRLVAVPLPQLGPGLDRAVLQAPGLRLLSAPLWRGPEILALGLRGGRLVLMRARPGAGTPTLCAIGQAPAEGSGRYAGPWTNRLGDAFWTGPAGSVACPAEAKAGDGEAVFRPWPDGFSPILAQPPWRDRADGHHQLGTLGERYAYAALGAAALNRLDGPHLAADGVTYAGAERFDVPWQSPAESPALGIHAGSLLVPLLAMPRDTILLALPVEGPRGDLIRGKSLPAPVTGQVLHHAHGAGLRRLPVGLEVGRLADAGAVLHDRTLFLWSRCERRAHLLRLRA